VYVLGLLLPNAGIVVLPILIKLLYTVLVIDDADNKLYARFKHVVIVDNTVVDTTTPGV
jgi:hypothetical protein